MSARLEAGDSLENAASEEHALPSLWIFVVSVASRRNELPGALEELARTYEVRAQQWISVLRVILGPVLLVLIGIVLGFLVISILSPLIQVIEALSS